MEKSKELAKNTIIISIGKVCTQFLSFLLLPLYTSILSTSEYGTVDLLMTYQQLIVCTVFCQIEQAIFRFLIEKRNNEKDSSIIISSCFLFVVIQTIVLGLVFLVLNAIGFPYALYLYRTVAVAQTGFKTNIMRE